MKQHKTKLRLTVSVLFLFMLIFATPGWAQRTPVEAPEVLASGSCGTNAGWQVKVTTVLKQKVYSLEITGSGAMTNYSSSASVPWKSFVDPSTGNKVDLKDYISKVTISDDITTIGNYAFDGLSKVSSFELPSKLTTIGTRAFALTGMKKVFLPATLTTIAADAYSGCSSLAFIQFDGTYTKSLTLSGLPSTGRLITKYEAPSLSGAIVKTSITPPQWLGTLPPLRTV